MRDNWPMFALLSFIALLMALFIGDCVSSKQVEPHGATVGGKIYVPEQVRIVTTTDADGHAHIDTVTDPEEFKMFFRCDNGKEFWQNVGAQNYGRFQTGDKVYVSYHEGQWIGIKYGFQIQERAIKEGQ